jgi:hypothetical protein
LAPRLRAADVREIRAALGVEPLGVLRAGVARSDPCFAIQDPDDTLLALFGATPDRRETDVGVVWLLAANELTAHPFWFLRNCRSWVERLHRRYRVLRNYVDARNAVHIRWLQWCGFTILGRLDHYGVERRPFYEFTRAARAEIP